MTGLSESSLAALAEQVASVAPAPGAGPSTAWTCALAAALVEMVSAVMLGKEPADPAATAARRDRAATLRAEALGLADRDVAAYSEVLAVMRRRDEPGHPGRVRAALSAAADPPLGIAEAAAEVTRLAADAAAEASGGVRGEALTAVTLGEAATRAGARIVEFNLGGDPDDPRPARARELTAAARADLERAESG